MRVASRHGPGRGRPRPGRALVYLMVAALAAGVGAGVAVALTSGGGHGYTGVSSRDVPAPTASASPGGASPGGGTPGALNSQQVADRVDPGVVDISAPIAYSGGTTSEGTGMVISSNGLVLTNNHVVNEASTFRATLVTSGRAYTARLLGYDAADDVALLQMEGASGLPTVPVGNSARLSLRASVLAIGNADGQGGSPTVAPGVITGLNSTVTAEDQYTGTSETLHGMLATSADVISGDSGGPLADTSGDVIGMDTAGNGDGPGGSATQGFAVPINKALSVARQIAGGQASSVVHIGLPGFMGVQVADASQGCQAGPGGGPAAPVTSGAMICQVYPGTPAASAGLQAGDVITAAGGQPVTSAAGLTAITGKYQPGQDVPLSYVTSSGARASTTVKLIAGPAR